MVQISTKFQQNSVTGGGGKTTGYSWPFFIPIPSLGFKNGSMNMFYLTVNMLMFHILKGFLIKGVYFYRYFMSARDSQQSHAQSQS